MAAKSKNKHDVYEWIFNEVIPSCKTRDQKISCSKLINNWSKTYESIYYGYILTRQLLIELNLK